jgi:hypothetical protein
MVAVKGGHRTVVTQRFSSQQFYLVDGTVEAYRST